MATECQHEWQLAEYGYVRTWRTAISDDGRLIVAACGGLEDFSDEGDGVMLLECRWCGESGPISDGVEIDYT